MTQRFFSSEKKKPRIEISINSPASSGLPKRKLSIRETGSATARSNVNNSPEHSFSLDSINRSQMYSASKLPAVTTLINLKPNHNSDPEMHKTIIELTKYAQSLEQQLQLKDREIQRLEVINKYLSVSLQNKEKLIVQTFEENRRLKNMPSSNNGMNEDRKFSIHKIPVQAFKLNAYGLDTGRESQRAPDMNISKSGFERRKSVRENSSPPSHRDQSYLLNNKPMNYIKIDDMNELNHETDNLRFLNDLIRNEDNFMQEVPNLDRQSFFRLYDAIQAVKINNGSLKSMVAKLKRILKASISMATSLVIVEAIERVVEEVCSVLNCDRATVWIYDKSREELWSQSAKGSDQTIRVPADKGIVGQVITQGELLNIPDAYAHEKFNKAIDIKTGYKTNTILAVPIKDENEAIVGVVQAINKLGVGAVFTKDDESLLTILANLSGVVLRNSISYNQQVSLQNTLRSAIQTGIILSPLHNLSELIPTAENRLKNLIKSDKVRIALKSANNTKMFVMKEDGQKQECPVNCGIMGKVIRTGEIESVGNGYGHGLFNGLIDIETSLPIYCMPIKDYITENVIGAIQVINTKGLQGLAALNRVNTDPLDIETLNNFANQLSQAIKNCYEWEGVQDKQSP